MTSSFAPRAGGASMLGSSADLDPEDPGRHVPADHVHKRARDKSSRTFSRTGALWAGRRLIFWPAIAGRSIPRFSPALYLFRGHLLASVSILNWWVTRYQPARIRIKAHDALSSLKALGVGTDDTADYIATLLAGNPCFLSAPATAFRHLSPDLACSLLRGAKVCVLTISSLRRH
jgi:hypothetical protein